MILSLDIGGTNVRMGLVDECFNIHASTVISSSNISSDDNESAPLKLTKIIKHFLKEQPQSEIRGIVIGLPSIISRDRKTVLQTPNIVGLNQCKLSEYLEEKFSVPTLLEKDVNLLLIYDVVHLKKHTEKMVSALGFYIGTGLGFSIMNEGRFIIGEHGVAGELGHVPIFENTRVCQCGNTGCTETLVSGKYLVEIRDKYFANTDISDIFINNESHQELERFISNLGMVIAGQINIFDISNIFLGGGVLSIKMFPMTKLQNIIKKFVRKPYPFEHLNFVHSKSNLDNGIIGGALLFYTKESTSKNDMLNKLILSI